MGLCPVNALVRPDAADDFISLGADVTITPEDKLIAEAAPQGKLLATSIAR